MRAAPLPGLTFCADDDHARCPHRVGTTGIWLWRRRPTATAVLCDCSCHAGCPVAGPGTVPLDVWQHECTCPGAARGQQARARTEEQRRAVQAALAEVRFDDHPDAALVESRLRVALQAHDAPPLPGLTGWSQVLAASKARRGTRWARLLLLAGRAVASTVGWSRRPATGEQAANRREVRRMYRAAGVAAALAAALAGVAARSSGWRRLVWATGASGVGLAAGGTAALTTGLAQLSRASEGDGAAVAPAEPVRHPRAQPASGPAPRPAQAGPPVGQPAGRVAAGPTPPPPALHSPRSAPAAGGRSGGAVPDVQVEPVSCRRCGHGYAAHGPACTAYQDCGCPAFQWVDPRPAPDVLGYHRPPGGS